MSRVIMLTIVAKTRFNASIVFEAQGFSGGIWILWDKAILGLDLISVDDQIINTLVYSPQRKPWLLSAIYVSPNPLFQQHLWYYLGNLGVVVNLSWLLLGDFNQVSENSEKRGGAPPSGARIWAFRECISNCGLIDLGFSGPRFTWTNMRKGLANVQERLDRVLCSRRWLNSFSEVRVLHLPRTRSDHCPLMVHDGRQVRLPHSTKLFHLQEAWYLHPQFEEFLTHCWGRVISWT